jgi:hypothetical protein
MQILCAIVTFVCAYTQVSQLQTLRGSLNYAYGKGSQELLLELMLLDIGLPLSATKSYHQAKGVLSSSLGKFDASAARGSQELPLARRGAECELLVVVSAGEGLPLVPG